MHHPFCEHGLHIVVIRDLLNLNVGFSLIFHIYEIENLNVGLSLYSIFDI